MKNKAIILDRDGVINVERGGGYTFKLSDFDILPGVMAFLKIVQDRGYKLIVISNQGGISKGIYDKAAVEVIHQYLFDECKKHGVDLAELYYCPHHSNFEACICRKPDSLFVEKALARFAIDPAKSYFIGDKERDVQAGEKVGVKGILIKANSPLKDILPQIN